jgi:hypothetical protein
MFYSTGPWIESVKQRESISRKERKEKSFFFDGVKKIFDKTKTKKKETETAISLFIER